jgi:hypothetical protein
MYAPLRDARIEYAQYQINERFEIADDIDWQDGDWMYYVNYFGICEDQVDAVLGRFGGANVVLDNCQAFFAAPRNCVATIYSPRKFFGVPDGGLLVTSQPVSVPQAVDIGSKQRADYLLRRMSDGAEAGYASYQVAEQSLEELEPRRMSVFTERLLASIDLENAQAARNDNFRLLHEKLGQWNKCQVDAANVDGPLCYPFVVDAPGLRERLIESRVFVATYWRDVLRTVSSASPEGYLVTNLIPLPCDQRYGTEEMMRVVQICADFMQPN